MRLVIDRFACGEVSECQEEIDKPIKTNKPWMNM